MLHKHWGTRVGCWIALYGKVYDFTSVFEWHPIQSLKNQCGKDGTDYYAEAHPESYLAAFKVLGELEPAPTPKVITRQELAEHNNRKSLWVEIDGLVYDLTTVLRWHPAGPESLLIHGGKDASVLFSAVHERHYLGHFDPVAVVQDDN